MSVHIALFRGINVGGRNPLPMKTLTTVLESLGCSNVRTYIQSGNIVFTHTNTYREALAQQTSRSIEAQFGFLPQVLLLSVAELQSAIDRNPFADATTEPKTLHLWFLKEKPGEPNLAKIHELKSDSESFCLIERVFYLHAPDGIGRSRLAARVEKLVGAPATARNWRTVNKLLEMTTLVGDG